MDDKKGNKKRKRKDMREYAESLVRDMSVAVTGARPGDTIRGCTTHTKDAVFQLASTRSRFGGLCPPTRIDVITHTSFLCLLIVGS